MIKVYITAAGQEVDYSRYVTQIQIQDAINVPTLCTLKVGNIDWQWTMPLQGSYVQIWSDKYQKYYFTGYITAVPELQPLGVTNKSPNGVEWNCILRCTSEEYLLNNKTVPFIPPFIGMTQGQILAQLAEILAPGLLDVSSYVASGDIVPYYQYNTNQSWSQIAKQFGDQSFYRYKVIDKTLYFQPHGYSPLGVSYDDTQPERTFNPYGLSCQPLDIPLLNDVMIIGMTEGGSYVTDYFMGDGYTGSFPLTEQAFRTDTELLLNETWQGSSINTQNWTVEDPQSDFTIFQGALNIVGGDGLNNTYLLYNNGIELGGSWYFQHGACQFTSASEGIVGGLFSQYPYTLENCILGFWCTPASGNLMTISPIINGATGNNVTPVQVDGSYLNSYLLSTQVIASQLYRYSQKWSAQSEVFGGTEISSDAEVTFFIYETSPNFPLNPTMVSWQFSLTDLPAFCEYVPFDSINLNASVTQTMIYRPPRAALYETPYFGTPQQFNRITDLVQSQVRVDAATTDGGLLDYTVAQRSVPYDFEVWEAVGPTAWMYMTILQPSYLFSLPNQQQQVGMPIVSHVSIIYPPYLLPPLPGQTINVSVPNVSGANFDLTKALSWLLAQQDVSAVTYGWSGTVTKDPAPVNLGASNAMLFDEAETQYTAGVSGGTLTQPPPSSELNQISSPFISISASGSNLTGSFGNLPSATSNWRLDVYNATDTFYYQGAASVDSSHFTWTFNSTASGSIVVFAVPASAAAPTVGSPVTDPASTYHSAADTNSAPSSPRLVDYTVNVYSEVDGALTLTQSGLPMVVLVDGSLFSMSNVPAGSGSSVYQVIYTDPSTELTYVVFDSRVQIPVYDGLVASYRVPVKDPAFVPIDQVALGAYAIQNRSRTKDNALAIFAYLQNPNNLSPYEPSTGQSTSSQQQAQDCAQVLAGLSLSPQFLITDIQEDATEINPSVNWSASGGTISRVWDSTAPVGGNYVVEFQPSGTDQFSFVTNVPWGCTGNLVSWTQKVQSSDLSWYVQFEIETTDSDTVYVQFVAGSGAPTYSAPVLTVPYEYPDNYWSQEQFDLALLWASYGDQTLGMFSVVQTVKIQASETFYLDSLYNGIANPAGALSKSYDMLNGFVDEQYIETLSNAWAAYSLSYYTQVTADPSVQNGLESVLTFLASQQWSASGDLRYNLLTAGYDQYYQIQTGGGGGGTTAFVQVASGGTSFANTNSIATTLNGTVAGGAIVVMLTLYDYYQQGIYTFAVSDSKGNSYTKIVQSPYTAGVQYFSQLMYMADNPSGGDVTVTVVVSPNDSNFDFTVAAAEYTGISTAGLDGATGNWYSGADFPAAGATTTYSGPVSPSNEPDVIIAAAGFDLFENNPGDMVITSAAGWTRRIFTYPGNATASILFDDKISSALGQQEDSWSWTNVSSYPQITSDFSAVIAAFKSSGGGSGPSTKTYSYQFKPGINEAVKTEDNLVAYMAFSWAAYALGNPTLSYTNVHDNQNYSKDCQTLANEIETAIQAQLWIDSDAVTASGRFAFGVSASGVLDSSVALVDQTLGSMFQMANGNFTRAANCLDFIFQYSYESSPLYGTGLQITLSSASASYNETYEQLNTFDGLTDYAPDPVSNDFVDADFSCSQEGVWEAICALSEFFISVQYPYNSTKLPLTQLSPGTRQQKTLGFGQQAQTASIVSGNNYSDTLMFYNDTIPLAQVLVECRYRKAQAAVARVTDSTNVAIQAAISGDNGYRGAVIGNLSPLPRTSVECEAAAQAKIADAEAGQYQGNYTVEYYFYDGISDFPCTGKYLNVNSPKRVLSNKQFLVTQVTTNVIEMKDEIVTWQINFGQDTYLNKLLSKFYLPPNVLRPTDTAQPPTPQELAEVGTYFIGDLDNVKLTMLSGSGATIDVGITPASGIEVRTSDLGWTTNKANNLIGVFTTQQFNVSRTQMKQAWYMRQVNGSKTSRYTTKISVNAQNRPAAPTAQVLWSPVVLANNTSLLNVSPLNPQVSVGLKGNFLDVYGCEVRAADNQTVLYRHQYLSTSDLAFQYDNSKSLSRTLAFWVYTFDMLNEYSDGTYCQASLLKPPAPRVSVLQISGNAATVGFDQLGTTHPIQSTTVQVAVSGASAFNPPIQETQLTGQPKSYAVSVGETGIYLIRAKRNDYLGDSDWSSTIRAELTAGPGQTASGNLIPNGDFEQWGSLIATSDQEVGLPLGWIIEESSPNGYTTQDAGHTGTYSVGLNVGTFKYPNNFVGLQMQQAIAVAPAQVYALSFYAKSQIAGKTSPLSHGFYARIRIWDSDLQNQVYANLFSNIGVPYQWTPYQLTFTIPNPGDTFVQLGSGSVAIKGTLSFVPGQLYVEFLNYDANTSGAFFVDTAVLDAA